MVMKNPVEGKKIRIRSANENDAEFTLNIRNQEKYMPKLNVDLETQKKWINEQAKMSDSYFVVIERISGEKIGVFSIYNICGNEAETGRLVLKGNQIETIETMLLFHDYVYENIGVEKLYSYIEAENMAAVGLALRLGSKKISYYIDCKTNRKFIKVCNFKEDYYSKSRNNLFRLIERFGER
ncbi:MAG: GNAT family N-acetyltransferase [Oscillospiraceae bacterium]